MMEVLNKQPQNKNVERPPPWVRLPTGINIYITNKQDQIENTVAVNEKKYLQRMRVSRKTTVTNFFNNADKIQVLLRSHKGGQDGRT